VRSKTKAVSAALIGLALVGSQIAVAGSASADQGTTTLSAGNGQVGTNQVLTATFAFSDAGTSCDDQPPAVNFDFKIGDSSLGSVNGTCTPVSNGSFTPIATWTGTLNWTPTKPGSVTITTHANQLELGGSPAQVGKASKKVQIAQAPAPKPTTPSQVRNLKVTGVSTNTVSLNWDAPSSSGSAPIGGYVVNWTGPTSGQVSVAGNTTNANIGSLSAGSTYTFSVLATNASGWGAATSVTQNTANAPTPAPVQQQTLVGPMWEGGGAKVKSGKWKTFNDSANLDTNAGHEARLSAVNRSASIKSVVFRYKGDFVQVRATLKKGAKRGSFTLVESAPAFPGFTAMRMTRDIRVVK
jgi:hypothetical protein